MSSLFASLQNAAGALNVFENAIGVVQGNVTNASTPGYVNRTPALATDILGNVATAATENSRNQFAEQAVWQQNGLLGFASAQADNLSGLQSQFDVSGKSGIPGALSNLYTAFSSWSTTPDDATARNQVLTAAGQVVQAFNQAAANVQSSVTQANQQISSSVDQINQLASKIVVINTQIRNGGKDNPGLQTQLYNALQQLSNFSTVSVHMELDGTATVLMNEQVPLVIGATQTALQLSYSSTAGSTAMPDARITTADGQDVTSSAATGGQLGGLLQVRNETLPALIGNANQQGSLNQLAQSIADRVNTLLTNGQTPSGTQGAPLFTYSSNAPTGIAGSLSVNPAITVSGLAAIQPGPPAVANGVATELAGLGNSSNSADMISGMNYTDFYSAIASNLGSQATNASQTKDSQTDLLNQAENARSQASGISLDQQATQLLQFQQAYAASSKLISVIDQMTGDLMNMIQ
ncbi:MAG: flagellar hook-associated protein FlgK [Acidobacteriaceae bacterium]|nr:flagellar hook-associated protein FlgK [Acidobacteriaceae bacterium]